MGSINPWITRVEIPETDLGVLDLVRTLVPPDTDPERTLMAVEMLACYKGQTVDKTVVKDVIAEALHTHVSKLAWPVGWRRADWISFRSSPR
jgi:hypothetical protein